MTPSTASNGPSMHQKQPPANVATEVAVEVAAEVAVEVAVAVACAFANSGKDTATAIKNDRILNTNFSLNNS